MPTPVLVGHVILERGGAVSIPVPSGWNAAMCAVDGVATTRPSTISNPAGWAPAFHPGEPADSAAVDKVWRADAIVVNAQRGHLSH